MRKLPDYVYLVCKSKRGGIIAVHDDAIHLPGGRLNDYVYYTAYDMINDCFYRQADLRLKTPLNSHSKPAHILNDKNGSVIWYYAAEEEVNPKAGNIEISLDEVVRLDDRHQWLLEFDENVLSGKSVNQLFYSAVAKYHDKSDIREILKYLDLGADPNYIGNYNGDLPLGLAAREANITLMDALLKHGADVNKSSNYGAESATALMEIMKSPKCSMEAFNVLFRYGVDIQKVDHYGNTALHAVSGGNRGKSIPLDVVQKLIDLGIDVNQKNVGGTTALHQASIATLDSNSNVLEVLEILIENGADSQIRDTNGCTLFELPAPVLRQPDILKIHDFIRACDENKRLLGKIRNDLSAAETIAF